MVVVREITGEGRFRQNIEVNNGECGENIPAQRKKAGVSANNFFKRSPVYVCVCVCVCVCLCISADNFLSHSTLLNCIVLC
jgi:hypothetical protein